MLLCVLLFGSFTAVLSCPFSYELDGDASTAAVSSVATIYDWSVDTSTHASLLLCKKLGEQSTRLLSLPRCFPHSLQGAQAVATPSPASDTIVVELSATTCLEGASVTVTATTLAPATTTIVVMLNYAGTAVRGTDFTVSPSRITILPGTSSGTVVISAAASVSAPSQLNLYVLSPSSGSISGRTYFTVSLLPAALPSPSTSASATATRTSSPSLSPVTASPTPSSTRASSASNTPTRGATHSVSPTRSSTASRSTTWTASPSFSPTNTPTNGVVTVTASTYNLTPGSTACLTATLTSGVLPVPVTIQLSVGSSGGPVDYTVSTHTITIQPGATTGAATIVVGPNSIAPGVISVFITTIGHATLDPSMPASFALLLHPPSGTSSVSESQTSSSSPTSSASGSPSFTPSISLTKSTSFTRSPYRTYSVTRTPSVTPVSGAVLVVSANVTRLTPGRAAAVNITLISPPIPVPIAVHFAVGGTSGLVKGTDYILNPPTGSTVTIPAGGRTAQIFVTLPAPATHCSTVAAGTCLLRITINSASPAATITGNTDPGIILN